MKRRIGLLAVLVVTGSLAVVAAASAHTDSHSTAALAISKASCFTSKIGFEGPLTGPAGFLGQEQSTWSQLAVRNFNKKYKTHFAVKLGDNDLDPALARTLAQKDISDAKTLAVIGPSTSGGVRATGKLFASAHLAAITPSATLPELTNGQFPTFFRVVPNDNYQGAGDATYMARKLKIKRVFIISSQEPYGEGLANITQAKLKALGVKVDRDSVDPAKETDYSPQATKTSSDTDIVFTPWQVATSAQTLSQQLLQQGKKARVFGTDGTFDPSHFKPTNGYVSSFAPDVHGLKSAKTVIAQYNGTFHKSFGTFGPPSYTATLIAADAMRKACLDGKATRAEVVKLVAKTRTASLWGTTISFDKHHDPANPRSFIFKITNGNYKFVTSSTAK
jgi:branched-chain amino acid transport system substrate-binding protein